METDRHKWLKRLALEFLKTKGCNVVCKEVPVGKLNADALGLNMKRKEIRIVECKQDINDFRKGKIKLNQNTGYIQYCHYLYIICPEGLIKPTDVDINIGLIYAKADDSLEVIKKPIKNTSRLKSYFETILKNTVHRLSNEVFYQDEKEYKDPTDNAFSRNANIFYSAIRCKYCKHVTKALIHKQLTQIIKCKNCGKDIIITESKIREIIGFNNKFITQLNKLAAKGDETTDGKK